MEVFWGLASTFFEDGLCNFCEMVAGSDSTKSLSSKRSSSRINSRPKSCCILWAKGRGKCFWVGFIATSLLQGVYSGSSSDSKWWLLAWVHGKLLYRMAVEEVSEDDYTLPLSSAEVQYFNSQIFFVSGGPWTCSGLRKKKAQVFWVVTWVTGCVLNVSSFSFISSLVGVHMSFIRVSSLLP